jgi:muramoyltetrapeptide carboxypeptidase
MKRESFVGIVATATADAVLAGCAQQSAASSSAPARAAPVGYPAELKAPLLRQGDVVGIIAPAGPVRRSEELEHAREQARLLGLEPRFGKHVFDQYGYLAGNDARRADDFNRFAKDPSIRAIFAVRGGYGTMRILDDLDYAALAADPKVVMGFSDLTALLNAITARTGMITFHGPVAGHAMLSAELIGGIRRAVMSKRPLGALRAPEIRMIVPGTARGRLAGGNLSVIAALSGTPYAVPSHGRILFVEDVHEAPYRVDRMLTQLRLSGALRGCAGIALGKFQECVPKSDELPSLTVEQTLGDRLEDLGKPVLAGARVGHLEDQWTLPVGMIATIDGPDRCIRIDEPAVA